MATWNEIIAGADGTTYIGRNTDGRKVKVFVPVDGRAKTRQWLWDRFRKVWIEKIMATGGHVTLPKPAKVAKDQELLPAPDRYVVDWQSIRKTKDGYVPNTPEHTKRGKRLQMGEVRGQRGNRGTAGNV
jgi:hypothetical protein